MNENEIGAGDAVNAPLKAVYVLCKHGDPCPVGDVFTTLKAAQNAANTHAGRRFEWVKGGRCFWITYGYSIYRRRLES